MSLEMRCPEHPAYVGKYVPGAEGRVGPAIEGGAQSCSDCWELYRMAHEDQS